MKKTYLILFLIISNFSFSSYAESKNQSLIVTTINGQNFNLADKEGKVVLINLWAKWCSNCRAEMSVLEEIKSEIKSENFEILGLNVETQRHRAKVTEISKKLSYENAMLIDAKESSFEEPNSLPVIYIIDKTGKIHSFLKDNAEDFNKENIIKIIKSLLN